MSGETTYSSPMPELVLDLVKSHSGGYGLVCHTKCTAKTQHSSGLSRGTNTRPLTFESSASSRLLNGA